MTTNNVGHLVDDSGNVAVDFVWGNMPLQPNDDRPNAVSAIGTPGRLDYTLDNHSIAEAGWNGYPLYTPNSAGEQIDGTAYIVVPNVVGLATASAIDALKDAGYAAGNITTAGAVTPALTAITLTSNVASVTVTAHGYSVGDVVTIAGLTNGSGSAAYDADLNGNHTITEVPDANNIRWAQTHANITTHSGITGVTAKVAAKAGKIKTQSTAPNANSVSTSATITITPYFAS
jgi:hypothetical protein